MPYTTLQDRLAELPFGDTAVILSDGRRALVQRHPQSSHPRITVDRWPYVVTYVVHGDLVTTECVRHGSPYREEHVARCAAPTQFVVRIDRMRTPL